MHQDITGVTDERRAGVGHQGHVVATFESHDELSGAAIVAVVALPLTGSNIPADVLLFVVMAGPMLGPVYGGVLVMS